MKKSLVSIAVVLAAAGSANTTTTTAVTTTTACAAEAILDACLDTTEGYLSLCGSQDYSCLCDKYTAIMTCFANCPNDDRQYGIDSQKQLYCSNASAFPSTTTGTKTSSKTGSTQGTASTTNDASSKATDGATTTYGGGDTATDDGVPTQTAGAVNIIAPGQRGPGLLAAFGIAAAALL